MNKLSALLGALLILVTGAAAVGLIDTGGGSSAATATATTGTSATHARVPIAAFAFKPASVHIAVGGSVTWTNHDSAPHTATSDQGAAFDTGSLMDRQHKTVHFPTAGTFTYHCAFHPFMHGTVIVG